jgi:hypothetical protein
MPVAFNAAYGTKTLVEIVHKNGSSQAMLAIAHRALEVEIRVHFDLACDVFRHLTSPASSETCRSPTFVTVKCSCSRNSYSFYAQVSNDCTMNVKEMLGTRATRTHKHQRGQNFSSGKGIKV